MTFITQCDKTANDHDQIWIKNHEKNQQATKWPPWMHPFGLNFSCVLLNTKTKTPQCVRSRQPQRSLIILFRLFFSLRKSLQLICFISLWSILNIDLISAYFISCCHISLSIIGVSNHSFQSMPSRLCNTLDINYTFWVLILPPFLIIIFLVIACDTCQKPFLSTLDC